MPGSLLLGTDNYSDVSEYSGRSLDSKIGGKKVSFNKAVRVKQYPWKPDSEHLTLPSNRFWFKVYKNNVSNDSIPKENVESIHDSLAPIAEVDDQDIERNGFKQDEDFNNYSNQPTDPPVDYFDDIHLRSHRGINGARRVWEENCSKSVNDNSNISNQWNDYGYRNINDQQDKIDENSYSTSVYDNTVLPHSNFRNDFTSKRSTRKLDNLKGLERRSRSHDEYMDDDNRFKYLKKADKAVSTEDIGNGHISPSNRFFKGSRDIATQCYGTLSRNKNQSRNTSSSSQTNSYISNTERLKNFKPQRPGLNLSNIPNAAATSPKKDYSLEKVSNVIRTRTTSPKSHPISNQTKQNYKQYSQKFDLSSKADNNDLKPIGRTEKGISNIIQKQANNSFNRFNSKSEQNSLGIKTNRDLTSREPNITGLNRFNSRTEPNSMDNKNNRENTIRYTSSREPNDTVFNQFNPRNGLLDTKNNRENTSRNNTHGIGFLRGHQIPLSEVNTNTNRKFTSRNNSTINENHIPRKNFEKCPAIKPDEQLSKGYQAKRYLSPPNNHERRSFRNTSNSAKSEGSMIDWSLSGFQLASKPENSISDSEYTIHRRPPLLMYIPGVSHHDRPAIEDDRLSALSDISRSEINDSFSSYGGSVIGDFRRRQSMREGKSKWLKWRSK